MRIGIDAAAAWTGGGASRVRELAATFDALAPQHEYVFVVTERARRDLDRTPPKTTVVEVPRLVRSAPLRVGWELTRLPRMLNAMSVDWILAPFNVLPLNGLDDHISKAVIVSSILPLVPAMWKHLSLYQQARLRTLRLLTRRSVRAATHVFPLSSEARQLLADKVSSDKLTILPMAPPNPDVIELARRSAVDVPGDHFFVVAADLLPYKGIEDAIQATKDLIRRGRDVALLVCGNPVYRPYAEEMHSLAEEAGRRILFLGGLAHHKVLSLMAKASATLVCSRFESGSRVPVEAMGIGSPLICADTPNAREVCGDASLYYIPGDHAALGNMMEMLLDDPDMQQDLQVRGSNQIAGRDWLSATRIILEVLERGELN